MIEGVERAENEPQATNWERGIEVMTTLHHQPIQAPGILIMAPFSPTFKNRNLQAIHPVRHRLITYYA